ncbi:Tigger transposable element-derived protein 5 [Ceratobasidium sp. 414]|nr:Tigger transposable element-derived protein 5 [Ceratobasidium sp. 414]
MHTVTTPPLYYPFAVDDVPRTRRQNLTFKQRLEVADFYHANKHRLPLEQMVQPLRERGFLTICATTIRRCVNREDEDRAYVESGDASRLNAKRQTLVCLPEVEAALLEWVKQKQEQGIPLASELICGKARLLCEQLGVPEESRLKFSKSWLEGFKRRNGLENMPRVNLYGEPIKPRASRSRGLVLAAAPLGGVERPRDGAPLPYFYQPHSSQYWNA